MAGTTTNYAWTYPTSTDLVKDGATAIQTAIQGADTTLFTALGGNYPGMRLVKSQTIGSAVASVTVTNAFSTTYENYKIMITGGAASIGATLRLSLGGITTGYYAGIIYNVTGTYTTVAGAGTSNAAYFDFAGSTKTDQINMDVDLHSPFLAKSKVIRALYNQLTTTGNVGTMNGFNVSTTSATDLTIATSSGTLTGGTIYVYGYGKS